MERLLEGTANLAEVFDRMWSVVRQANLYGGRPRDVSSAQSVVLARQALDLAAADGDPRFMAEARYMMAYAFNANEEYLESLPYYRESVRSFEEAGDHARAARIRLGFITALSVTGQSREALTEAEHAGRFFREQCDYASLAKLATNVGAVHQRLDDHERAVQCHFDAASLFKRSGDDTALAKAYLNAANSLCFLDRFAESEELYGNCETIAATLGRHDLRAHSLYNKAYLYFLTGRFSQALAVYRDVRPIYLKDNSLRHAALCDLDETEIYVQLRLPHDALLLAQSAADSFLKLEMPYEQAKAIAFAGVALTQKRHFGDALNAFREAQTLMEQLDNHFWSALLDLYRAEVMFSIGRLWEAHSLACDADTKFAELGCPAKRVVALVLLGRVSMQLGRLDEAVHHARLVQELMDQTKIPLFGFACDALCAEIAEREGGLTQALDFYEHAAKKIAVRHTHLHHDELGITFFKGKAEIFESLAHLTLGLDVVDGPRRAYMWCEKAKSQMFVDALAPHLPSVRSRADEALLSRVERLRAEITGSYLRLRPEFRSTPSLPRGEEVELKEDELVRTLGELSKSDSEYVSLQMASSVRIEELQAALPAATTVVEYFFARDEVVAFVIDTGRFEVVRHLTPTKRLQFLAGRFQNLLKKFAARAGLGRSDEAAAKTDADELLARFYDEIFRPLQRHISSKALIVIPHGLLHRIPFHALYDGESYVGDRFDVTYAPSSSVLKYCLERTPVTGGPSFNIDGSSIRDTLIRQAHNASFVHLEVPVALRQDNPVLSGLTLADGALCVPDICSIRWDTNLTSLRMVRQSIDISGVADDFLCLVRALLYAGSRSLLVEAWNLRDDASSLFFSEFYRHWPAGQSKSDALKTAREIVRQEHPHPFSWAPFMLIGQS